MWKWKDLDEKLWASVDKVLGWVLTSVVVMVIIFFLAVIFRGPSLQDLGNVKIISVEGAVDPGIWAVRLEGKGIDPNSIYTVWCRDDHFKLGDDFDLTWDVCNGYVLKKPREAER